MRACMYLRKSRADLEAESNSNIDTLARHREQLNALSLKMGIPVLKEYKEVVSGDSIAARPVMQELLADIENGLWDAVFVVEIERLARGATVDQGIIAQTFKYTNTKIITPLKTYDPNNDYDEEYFEFGLFMSRREYKTINRRLQAGRLASVKEGKYIGGSTAYGYEKVKLKNDKGYTLEMVPDEASIVKLIFDWYVNGELQPDGSHKPLGTYSIARKLNDLGVKPKCGDTWQPSRVRDMIKNPVYAGKIRWAYRKYVKSMENGAISVHRQTNETKAYHSDGMHPPIIDEFTFARAQDIMNNRVHKPVPSRHRLTNPLAGLVYCSKCGRSMTRNAGKKHSSPCLVCLNVECDTKSALLYLVEERVLLALKQWCDKTEIELKNQKSVKPSTRPIENALKASKQELTKLYKQKNKIYEYLETGTYTPDVFNSRMFVINEKIDTVQATVIELEQQLSSLVDVEQKKRELIPKIKNLLDVYDSLDVYQKNGFLKEVLSKVVYARSRNNSKKRIMDDFTVEIYPNINV